MAQKGSDVNKKTSLKDARLQELETSIEAIGNELKAQGEGVSGDITIARIQSHEFRALRALVEATYELYGASKTLERLTWTLIALTGILIVLTIPLFVEAVIKWFGE